MVHGSALQAAMGHTFSPSNLHGVGFWLGDQALSSLLMCVCAGVESEGVLCLSLEKWAPETRRTAVKHCICRQEPRAEALCLDRGRCEHLAACRKAGAPHPHPSWLVSD